MRKDHLGERVLIALEHRLLAPEVKQLDGKEVESRASTPATIFEVVFAPGRLVVGQDGQAHHRPIITVEGADVVDEHPLRESCLRLTLDLNVDQEPGFSAVVEPDLE